MEMDYEHYCCKCGVFQKIHRFFKLCAKCLHSWGSE